MSGDLRPRHSAEDRLRRWDLKYNSDWVKRLMDEERPQMRRRAGEQFLKLVQYEQAARQVMSSYAIPAGLVSCYLCYVRELWKLDRLYQGTMLNSMAQERYDKWVKRTLDGEVLQKLAFALYSIQVGS